MMTINLNSFWVAEVWRPVGSLQTSLQSSICDCGAESTQAAQAALCAFKVSQPITRLQLAPIPDITIIIMEANLSNYLFVRIPIGLGRVGFAEIHRQRWLPAEMGNHPGLFS
jgi:hypothetical protein